MKTKDCYTELSIQIARLESKVDFLIEKLVNEQVTVSDVINLVKVPEEYRNFFKPKDLDQIK